MSLPDRLSGGGKKCGNMEAKDLSGQNMSIR